MSVLRGKTCVERRACACPSSRASRATARRVDSHARASSRAQRLQQTVPTLLRLVSAASLVAPAAAPRPPRAADLDVPWSRRGCDHASETDATRRDCRDAADWLTSELGHYNFYFPLHLFRRKQRTRRQLSLPEGGGGGGCPRQYRPFPWPRAIQHATGGTWTEQGRSK